jgi:hypothetical protein
MGHISVCRRNRLSLRRSISGFRDREYSAGRQRGIDCSGSPHLHDQAEVTSSPRRGLTYCSRRGSHSAVRVHTGDHAEVALLKFLQRRVDSRGLRKSLYLVLEGCAEISLSY